MRERSRYARKVSAARHRLVGAISSMALLIAVVWVTPAWAAEIVVLDADQILYGEEGSTSELAEVTIDEDRIGSICTMRVHTENQFSVHPGNDLLITTGGTQTVIEDVEAEPDAGRDLSADVVLGPVLLVELRFGSDQVSSMGFDLSVDCATTAPVVIGRQCTDTPTSTTTSSTSTTTSSGSTTDADNTTSTTADCSDPEPQTEPVTEVQVPPPTLPELCPDGAADGALTVDSDACPEPTTTAPPTTATPTTAPPATSPPTTAAAVQSTTTTAAPTTTGPSPTVKGLQIFRLPQTPAAAPVQGSPAYTG